jgi:serine/threonine protein kinase
VELLGRGGMGEVWRAHDTSTNRTVAIKLLPPHLAQDDTFVRRFRREAEAAARLNSPHIVPIHDYGEIDGRLFVNMRLIEGHDLQAVLAGGPLEPARAVRIIEGIALALHAAHKVGLLHRDVKPSNILLDENDFAYLIDFGIARAADETRLTKSGNMIGTFAYIAPERLGTRAEEDARADIYSLACVLYECLTGHPPFAGDTMAGLVAAHLNTPPPQPSTTQPNVPAQFDNVIATGMAKDPNRRYGTALELAASAQSAVTEPVSVDSAEPIPLDVEFDVLDVEEDQQRRSKNPFASLADRLGVGKGVIVTAIIVAAFAVVIFVIKIVAPTVKHESASSSPQINGQTPMSISVPPPPPATNATTPATPSTTQVVTAVAVDANGRPINGYQEEPPIPGNTLNGCLTPSSTSRTNGVYDCSPYAADAGTCWPAPPGSMLCLVKDDPWKKMLSRFTLDATAFMTTIAPDSQPRPLALLLDDGTRCTYISHGRSFPTRDDGYYGPYDCGATGAVLALPSDKDIIDQSQPLWTVKIGQVGNACNPTFATPCMHFPPPETRTVKTAWFAGV